ncbi:MAG: hypothetical protein HUK21_02110 [Fibrobacteraceae bacterium]|nr:hypothetical protein [Fibrobacteraceae bacterium]
MSEEQLQEIADKADMIIANYAFTKCDKGIRILLLSNPDQACVLNDDGEMIESAMDDSHVALVQAYYLKNKELMGNI